MKLRNGLSLPASRSVVITRREGDHLGRVGAGDALEGRESHGAGEAAYARRVPAAALLLVIGSNPSALTSGARTLTRVELAREVLGFGQARLANLFAVPSYRSGELRELGIGIEGWQAVRAEMEEAIGVADAVLLAYGVGVPSGPARTLFREQAAWLDARIAARSHSTWWALVGRRAIRRAGIGTCGGPTRIWPSVKGCGGALPYGGASVFRL